MKVGWIIAGVLVVLATPVILNAQGVEKGASQFTKPSKVTKSSKQIARAQNRVNRYFHNAVVTPALRECWGRLYGVGDITIDFTYRKSGNRWAFEKIAAVESNLPFWQNETALRCMQNSVGATSFPVKDADLRETYAKALVVRWTWPVPLPPKGAKAARINDGGGSGGTGSTCQVCASRGTYPYGLTCKNSKSGYTDCRSDINTPNVCSTGDACLSGAFGTSGGYVIIY